jgi:3-phosphoglycerate kinase
MVGVPKHLPHSAGLLMQKEYDMITHLMNVPQRPYMAIIGGVKISGKIEVLESLIKKVNILFIGGAMANTFLQAMGYKIGNSVTEENHIGTAKELIAKAQSNGVELILPTDVVVAHSPKSGVSHRTVGVSKIQSNEIALDIGKETMKNLIPKINQAKTIFWNGTLGMAEIPEFAWASRDLAHLMALRKGKADTIIGGGDTTAFVEKLGMHNKYRFVSTGGGASLELLAGKKLPAIEVLMSN